MGRWYRCGSALDAESRVSKCHLFPIYDRLVCACRPDASRERKMELYYEGLAAYLNFKSIYL